MIEALISNVITAKASYIFQYRYDHISFDPQYCLVIQNPNWNYPLFLILLSFHSLFFYLRLLLK